MVHTAYAEELSPPSEECRPGEREADDECGGAEFGRTQGEEEVEY